MDQPADTPKPAPARANISIRKKLLFSLILLMLAVLVIEFAIRPFVPHEIVGPSAVRTDSYYGKHLKKNYSGPVTAQGITYHFSTNSLGFRGGEFKNPPRGSVLMFGDSFGAGDTVNDGEEYASIVRDMLDERFGEEAIPAINAAVAGNGHGRWLKFLRRDAQQFEPRIVVMQLCNNDFCDNFRERLFTVSDSGALEERPVPPASKFRRGQEIVESLPILPYSRIYAVLKQGVKRTLTNEEQTRANLNADCPPYSETETSPFDDLTFVLLEECLTLCAENNWPVVAVTAMIPPGSRLDRLNETFEKFDAQLIFIPIKGDRPELFNKDPDNHWNADGHRLVADTIFEAITANPALQTDSADQPEPQAD